MTDRGAELDHRPLGQSGLMVSAVGIGCNAFGARIDAEQTTAVVDAAIDAGVTLFDTADVYGGEPGSARTLLGEALGGRRDDVVIATKFGGDMRGANGPDWGVRGSRRYVRKAVESACSGSAPTGSTSTSCTCPTRSRRSRRRSPRSPSC